MISRRRFLKISGLSVGLSGFAQSLFPQAASKPAAQAGPGPAAKLENMLAGVKHLAPEDYDARLQKAARLMAENKIDAVLLTGGQDAQYSDQDHVELFLLATRQFHDWGRMVRPRSGHAMAALKKSMRWAAMSTPRPRPPG